MIFASHNSLITFSEEETIDIARRIAEYVYPGLTIHLSGDLGAGKTVFVRGLSSFMGVQGVRSPSFTLVNEYQGRIPIAHVDLYRLERGDENELDLDSYIDYGYLLIVEWAEKLEETPSSDLWVINISCKNGRNYLPSGGPEETRYFTFSAIGEKAEKMLNDYIDLLKKEIDLQ